MKRLKENEILIVTDYNNTLVDYEAEFDYRSELYEDFEGFLRMIKRNISKSLIEFERKTGFTPVVCIVTNASFNTIDSNGYNGICNDLRMTFFNNRGHSKERIANDVESSCEKYIKYVIHKENDGYLEINPYGVSTSEIFKAHNFSDEAMTIQRPEKKRESVERLICDLGPIKSKAVIFAGDSIADDYPMKYAVTSEGVSKIFIRPGKVKKMKYTVMQQFCEAKGIKFVAQNPKNKKNIRVIDETTFKFLSEEQQKQLLDFSDGDYILLTNENSRGFVEGIYQSIDIVNSLNSSAKERGKD
ncbi:MAG: hypothetical protein IKJ33_05330 [Clostridia bacterium]|nr:hypothetical protein [Clostridia bacterium]